jgi:hypothetical protein
MAKSCLTRNISELFSTSAPRMRVRDAAAQPHQANAQGVKQRQWNKLQMLVE